MVDYDEIRSKLELRHVLVSLPMNDQLSLVLKRLNFRFRSMRYHFLDFVHCLLLGLSLLALVMPPLTPETGMNQN